MPRWIDFVKIMNNRRPDPQASTPTEGSPDPAVVPLSAPRGRTKEADGSAGVEARAWGGAGASTWTKPSLKTRQDKKSFLSVTIFLAGGASLIISKGIVFVWGTSYGLGAFIAIFVVLFLIVGLAQLGPREHHREVLLTVTNKLVRLVSDSAEIVIPLGRIVAFRVRDGARQDTTCVAVQTDWDVLYIELDSTAARQIITTLDGSVPSTLTESGLRPELPRRGRSLDDWTRAVRSLLAPNGYRGSQPNIGHLFAAVCDDRLGAEERIGAALALTGHPDAKTREILRTTARRIPQKALRLAILHVADDLLEDRHIARAFLADGHRWPV